MSASRANTIRRRALEYAKNRDWGSALKEYVRLAEVDNTNPNVFNELGDLQLKLGKKKEAFESFQAAVDAYANVSLFNNAVAVCKKILRLNPNDHSVYGKLARLRQNQGFKKEAENYANQFLDRVAREMPNNPDAFGADLVDLAKDMKGAGPVLERIADLLLQWGARDEGGEVLRTLAESYAEEGLVDRCEAVERKMKEIGHVPAQAGGEDDLMPEVAGNAERGLRAGTGAGWAGEGSATGDHGGTSAPERVYELNSVDLDPRTTRTAPSPGVAAGSDPSLAGTVPPTEIPVPVLGEEPSGDAQARSDVADDPGSEVGVLGQLTAEVTASIEGEDHRSHYDLGMAYLEMGLFTEAIREFQIASHSSMYQIRCFEMIGLCFLKQDQPGLAVKQLERGIRLVGNADRESLGLYYHLGLAYETLGETEKARTCFEEVYVVDVSFRDVAEKIQSYAS